MTNTSSALTRFLVFAALAGLFVISSSVGAQIQNPIQAAKDAFKKARDQQKPPQQPQPQPTQSQGSPASPASAAGDCCSPEALSKLASSVGFVDIVGVKLGMTLEQAVAAIKTTSPKLVIDIHDLEIEAAGTVTHRPRWILAHVRSGSRNPDLWSALDGSAEAVGVQLTPAPGPLVVELVSRSVTFATGMPVAASTLQEALRKKYGPESYQDAATIGWLSDTSGKPLRGLTQTQTNCITWPQINQFDYRGGSSATSPERVVLGHLDEAGAASSPEGYNDVTAKCVPYVVVKATFDQRPNTLVDAFATTIHSAGLQHNAMALTIATIKQQVENRRRQEEQAGAKRAAPKL